MTPGFHWGEGFGFCLLGWHWLLGRLLNIFSANHSRHPSGLTLSHSPQLWIALMRHTPAPRYKPDHTSTIPVVRSFYRQKPRRQHLCIVERLLDCCGECASPQFKLYTITLKHQREVFIVTTSIPPRAYLLPQSHQE